MSPVKSAMTALMLFSCLGTLNTALAQDYPSKPVRLIDPFPPGASTNIVSRLISQKFQEQNKQPMLVENRAGAGSNLGSGIVAGSPPDGYTLLLGTSSLAINPSLYRTMTFDPIKDLTPIILLVRTPNVLAIHPSLPVRDVKELIAYARANPGKLNYGSSGYGATNHLAGELFKNLAKVDIVHVPFKGGGEALAGLLSGQTQLMFSPPSTVGPHDKTGKLRIIAAGGDQRVPGLNVPTVAESGVPGFESSVWLGLFAPAGTPPAIIAKLNNDTNLALKDKQVIEVLQTAGLSPVGGTPDELKTVLQNDTTRLGAIVKASGAKVE